MKRISIQGSLGSYSHIAATSIFGEEIELSQDETFDDAIRKCSDSTVDFAVIPFENSTHGSVTENFDLLTKYNLKIIKELYLKINFHLLALPGVKFEDIKNVYTHKVSMIQIKKFLEENSQIEPHVYADNALAAEYIKNNNLKDSAAAASRLAAKLNGLEILKERIQDNPKNYTRFFVLSREGDFDKNSNKTSISFTVKHATGTLVSALKCFSDEGISLSKIESRPLIDTEWEYLFYVDLVAGINDNKMKSALKKIKESTLQLNILGSYPQGEYIDT